MKYFIILLNIITVVLIAISYILVNQNNIPNVDKSFAQEYYINIQDKNLVISNNTLYINSPDNQSIKIEQSNLTASLESFKSNFKTIVQDNQVLLVSAVTECNFLKIGVTQSKKFTDLVCIKEII